jgi:ATP-dependent DNA helicase RecG
MREGARELGYPEPTFDTNGFFTVTFTPIHGAAEDYLHQDSTKWALSDDKLTLLKNLQKESTLVELLGVTKRTDRSKFRKNVLLPLILDGLIEMTIPDKPRSQHQKYRITLAGKEVLREYLSETNKDVFE